jgi:thiol-disulfide isomerase/thioredoxin
MKKTLLLIIIFIAIITCSSCASDEITVEVPKESEDIAEVAPIEISKPETELFVDDADAANGESPNISDSTRFAFEYMEHNGQLRSNGEPHLFLDISENNPVIYLEADEVISKLESGTGIINLGFPICPWCREIIPHLLELAEHNNLPLYYMNIQPIRDVRELDESEGVITTTEGTPEYHRMVEILYDWLWEYAGLSSPDIKRIYVPTTIFVRDGEILYVHIATLRENYDGGYKPLDDPQLERVKSYLNDATQQIFNSANIDDDGDCNECP